MANICHFTCVVVANSELNLLKFGTILKKSARRINNNYFAEYGSFPGIYDVTRTELIRGYRYAAVYQGECKWSCYSSFRKGVYEYRNGEFIFEKDNPDDKLYASVEDLSEKLGLEIELFSKDYGLRFCEYHHIKDGKVLEEVTGYCNNSLYLEECETYSDFINNKDNEDFKYVTKEMFDNAKRDNLEYFDISEYEYPRTSNIDIYSVQNDPKYELDLDYYEKYAKSCKRYYDYINEHNRTVQNIYEKLKDFFEDRFGLFYDLYINNIRDHDVSKFHPMEFEPFRARLFPVDEKEREYVNKYKYIDYQSALEHHYSHNRHHPEFYYNIKNKNSLDEIPEMHNIDIAEMICDLWAMSLEFNNNTPLEYIESNDSTFKDIMNPKSYDKLVSALKSIDNLKLMSLDNNENSQS